MGRGFIWERIGRALGLAILLHALVFTPPARAVACADCPLAGSCTRMFEKEKEAKEELARKEAGAPAPVEERTHYSLLPTQKHLGNLDFTTLPAEVLEAEPMLFAADLNFSMANSGPVTRHVLERMVQLFPRLKDVADGKEPGYKVVIDSRTHNLAVGENPAIPGWHTDFVPRPASMDGQPDYSLRDKRVEMLLVNVSNRPGGVSNTQFVTNTLEIDLPRRKIYQHMDNHIESHPEIPKVKLLDGEVWKMDQDSVHRGTDAHASGARYLLRASIIPTSENLPATNEIRPQVQSYRPIMNFAEKNRPPQQAQKYSGKIETLATINSGKVSMPELKNQAMFQHADWTYAEAHAGPALKAMMNEVAKDPHFQKLLKEGRIRISSLTHMLQAGQSVDSPYWHHGDFYNYGTSPDRHGPSWIMRVSNKDSPLDKLQVSEGAGTTKDGEVTSFTTLDYGKVYKLGSAQLIKSHPADNSGWEQTYWVTVEPKDKPRPPRNARQTQVQVYLEDPSLGW